MTLSVQDILARGGALSRVHEGFRERPAQLRMAEAVAESLRARRHLVCEAPTGVGKSLGYLVPAVMALGDPVRRVVVATHTVALQDQLLSKDIPLLQSVWPQDIRAVRAVGRGRHLGLRRLRAALAEGALLFPTDASQQALEGLAALAVKPGTSGVRDEAEFVVPDDVWSEVASDGDNCRGQRCPHFNECFWFSMRRRMERADLIVANHALVLTDLALRRFGAQVLPDYDALIIDEAHGLEAAAQDCFGREVNRRQLAAQLRRLHTHGRAHGLLDRAGLSELAGEVQRCQQAASRQFQLAMNWLDEHPDRNGRLTGPRCIEDVLSGPLGELAAKIEDAAEDLEGDLVTELEAAGTRLRAAADDTQHILECGDASHVHFVEGSGQPALLARPIDVASVLREELFNRIPTVVLTSGTLATGTGSEQLDHFQRRVGAEQATALVLPSPFDLERQARLHVVRGMPGPTTPGFIDAGADLALQYIRRSRGGALLLFTSAQMLRDFRERIESALQAHGLQVLVQDGSVPRTELLRRFREDGNAVLLGLDSFWHGVDVPGPALRLVIIARLPFPVPTEPVYQAQAELIEADGGSAFRQLAMPAALVRFRQGFGRLIRTEDDEGIVLCLDPRAHDKGYGRLFQRSVAPAPVEIVDGCER